MKLLIVTFVHLLLASPVAVTKHALATLAASAALINHNEAFSPSLPHSSNYRSVHISGPNSKLQYKDEMHEMNDEKYPPVEGYADFVDYNRPILYKHAIEVAKQRFDLDEEMQIPWESGFVKSFRFQSARDIMRLADTEIKHKDEPLVDVIVKRNVQFNKEVTDSYFNYYYLLNEENMPDLVDGLRINFEGYPFSYDEKAGLFRDDLVFKATEPQQAVMEKMELMKTIKGDLEHGAPLIFKEHVCIYNKGIGSFACLFTKPFN